MSTTLRHATYNPCYYCILCRFVFPLNFPSKKKWEKKKNPNNNRRLFRIVKLPHGAIPPRAIPPGDNKQNV